MNPCSKEKEIERLEHVVLGNGEPGMRTDVALIKQRLETMPTAAQLKIYAFVGSGFGVFIGFVGQIIYKAVNNG